MLEHYGFFIVEVLSIRRDRKVGEMRSHRKEMEAVLSSMQEDVLAVDGEEHIISMNQAAGRIFNTNPSHVQGRTIQEAIRNIMFNQRR